MDQDTSIFMFIDVLDFIERQYPKLTKTEASTEANYSSRLHMWRLQQSSQAFAEHYQYHSKAAKEAQSIARNPDETDLVRARAKSTQSYHAKMSTKPCRYAPHLDHLVKAWEQKMALDEFRKEVQDSLVAGRAREMVARLTIKEVAERMAKDKPEEAGNIGLPRWERATSKRAASLAHAIVQFLRDQGRVIEGFLSTPIGAVLNADAAAASAAEVAGEIAITVLSPKKMKEQLKNVGDEDVAIVRQTFKTLLVSNWCMFKWATVRARLKGRKKMLDL